MPGPKLGQLAPSTTSEIEHIEKEDEGLVLRKRLVEGQLMATGGRQLEIRRLVPNREHSESVTYRSSTYQPVRVAPVIRNPSLNASASVRRTANLHERAAAGSVRLSATMSSGT